MQTPLPRMKRFQLFAITRPYSTGGAGDIAAEAETLEGLFAAYLAADPYVANRIEVLDMQERRWLDSLRALVEYSDEAKAVAAAVAFRTIGFTAVVFPGTGGRWGVNLTVK